MKTLRYRGALLGSLILSLVSSGLQAQEASPAPPPPKERPAPPANAPEGVRAERIRQRIRDLHAAGKHEEADRMVERMRQDHMKMDQRPMAAKTPRGNADKVEGGKADRKGDRKVHAGHPERKGPPQPMGSPPEMKIRNLKMAAGLLDAAGYRDQAGKAREEAGRIEDEMRKMAEMKKREDENRGTEQMKDRPDPVAGMREEMQKLRREVEELRGQLRKVKAEAEPRPDRERREENRPG